MNNGHAPTTPGDNDSYATTTTEDKNNRKGKTPPINLHRSRERPYLMKSDTGFNS
jgi:hypothetical protein